MARQVSKPMVYSRKTGIQRLRKPKGQKTVGGFIKSASRKKSVVKFHY